MPLLDFNHRFFEVISDKPFTRDDLLISWDEMLPEISPARKELEDQFWKSYQKRRPHSRLFNGILCRLLEFNLDESPARMTLGPIYFKTHLFTAQKGQNLSEDTRFPLMGLGVSSVLISSDNKLIFMKRSRMVAANAGQFDVFGGHIDPEKHQSLQQDGDLIPDPFTAIFHELVEEVNLDLDDIENLEGLGLITNSITAQYELVFRCTANLEAEKIIEKAQTAPDRSEYSHIILISNETAKIKILYTRYAKNFSPSGVGSLWLHRLNRENIFDPLD